ncbi:MAG: hypothetical protein OEW19_04140, partial [Acidobacteriota bacterium]|nr:hypothetical protein [Acidobacteriota bacterium]
MSQAARWFSRVVWLGILANLALAIPTLVAPERTMRSAGLPLASPLLWPSFSALLLVLLSAFYVPAAIDPRRYRPVAWLAVGARLAGVIFFLLFQPAEYRMLGYFDLAFFVPQLVLLVMLAPASATTSSAVP